MVLGFFVGGLGLVKTRVDQVHSIYVEHIMYSHFLTYKKGILVLVLFSLIRVMKVNCNMFHSVNPLFYFTFVILNFLSSFYIHMYCTNSVVLSLLGSIRSFLISLIIQNVTTSYVLVICF